MKGYHSHLETVPTLEELPTGFYSVAARSMMLGLPEEIDEGHACGIIRFYYYNRNMITLVMDIDDGDFKNYIMFRRTASYLWFLRVC